MIGGTGVPVTTFGRYKWPKPVRIVTDITMDMALKNR
jgi:hypothetical protein